MKTPAKEATLLVLLVLSSGLLWLSISTLLPNLSWDNMNLIWSTIVATIVFLVVWGLSVILVDKPRVILVGWAFASYGGVIWYQTHFFIIAASALFCFGALGMFRAKYQMRRTLDGGIVYSLRACLPLTATFLAAAIATAAFTTAPRQSLEIEALVPRWLFDPAIEALIFAMRGIDGSFGSSLLLGDSVDQKMSDALYTASMHFMRSQADRFQGVFPIAYAVGFFVTLRFFGIALYWIAIMMVSVVLRILRRFGIIGIRTMPANIFVYSFF